MSDCDVFVAVIRSYFVYLLSLLLLRHQHSVCVWVYLLCMAMYYSYVISPPLRIALYSVHFFDIFSAPLYAILFTCHGHSMTVDGRMLIFWSFLSVRSHDAAVDGRRCAFQVEPSENHKHTHTCSRLYLHKATPTSNKNETWTISSKFETASQR